MPDVESLIAAQFSAAREAAADAARELSDIIADTGTLISGRLQDGGQLLAFGNGGSAGQADHLVGELIGRYKKTRPPFAAISLPASAGAVTCIANDFSFEEIFERQVAALARPGDVAVGLSTSGTSRNVLRGLQAARHAGAISILLTGSGIPDAPADHILAVPSASTARIQEIHLLVIHAWCEIIDAA